MTKPDERCEDCLLDDKSFVPGQLRENSAILFVGQSPTEEDVRFGFPFCNASDAGNIFRQYVEELDKEEIIYSTTYAVKCFSYKKPNKKVIDACRSKLLEDIEFTNPKLIVALGDVASKAVTGLSTIKILKMNGKILREYNPPVLISVAPGYVSHPSEAARETKRKVFEKGILPALNFHKKSHDVEYKVMDTIDPVDIEVGFDIETDCLKPVDGVMKCFSISDGKKAIFVETENEN